MSKKATRIEMTWRGQTIALRPLSCCAGAVFALYARVSSRKQQKEGASLVEQAEACAKHAKELGIKVKAVESEQGSQRRGIAKLPILSRLIDQLIAGQIDGIMVLEKNRFSRTLTDDVFLTWPLANAGRLLSVRDDIKKAITPDERLIAGMMGVIHEYQRTVIGPRTKLAMDHCRSKGVILGPQVHWGYRKAYGTAADGTRTAATWVEPDPKTYGLWLWYVYCLRCLMTDPTTSDAGLAPCLGRLLNRQGFPTKSGRAMWDRHAFNEYDARHFAADKAVREMPIDELRAEALREIRKNELVLGVRDYGGVDVIFERPKRELPPRPIVAEIPPERRSAMRAKRAALEATNPATG